MPNDSQAITFNVANLQRATKAYRPVLAEVEYAIIHRCTKDRGSLHESKCVGFGPVGFDRVDLYLSEARRLGRGYVHPARHSLRALSVDAVWEGFEIAEAHGFSTEQSPEESPDGFATVIIDKEGNRLRILYDGLHNSDYDGRMILHERAPRHGVRTDIDHRNT